MTHITKSSDIELVARRARRSLELLEQRGERTWKLTADWAGPLRAAGGGTGGSGISRPTEAAALEQLDDIDAVAGLHNRYRAALALAVDAFDELDRIHLTVTSSGEQQRTHKRTADDAAMWCTSCAREGGREPRRSTGARWCRWCEDMTRSLAAEYVWEPNTAPPRPLVRRHLEGGRITVGDVGEAMRTAGVKRRATVPAEEGDGA